MPLGAEQGHTELENGHAPTVSYGESSRTAASRWTAPSIRVARGSLSQLGRSRYSAGRREVRPQHLPSRADHVLQHMLEGGPGLESSPGLIMTMDSMPLVASTFVALNVISHFPIQRLHQHSTGTFPRQLAQLLAHHRGSFFLGRFHPRRKPFDPSEGAHSEAPRDGTRRAPSADRRPLGLRPDTASAAAHLEQDTTGTSASLQAWRRLWTSR